MNNVFIYPGSILLTVLLAGLSYKYFESFFLRFKLQYAAIRSGDDSFSEHQKALPFKNTVPE